MTATDAMKDLLKCLQNSKVDDKVYEYFRDTLQFESASDFAGYFTVKTYEQGIVEEVLRHIPALATNRVQAGRLRLCWETIRAEVTEKTALGARQGSTPAIDMDTPLDPDDHRSQVEEFEKLYKFSLDAEVTICATQFARNLREFKKRAKTVEQLEKVKSEAQFFSVCVQLQSARSLLQVGHCQRRLSTSQIGISLRSQRSCSRIRSWSTDGL
jgi:hypothetical protein